MTPERRYELLATASAVDVEDLADRILADTPDIVIVAGPEPVSSPIRYRVPGTSDTTTVLGHVALTTCTVRLGGMRGDGVRSGRGLRAAVAAAVCDAEAERNGPLAAAVELLCAAADDESAAIAQERAAVVETTRLGGEA